MTIEVLISQSVKKEQIIIENKFYLLGYKRCKRKLHRIARSNLRAAREACDEDVSLKRADFFQDTSKEKYTYILPRLN